MANATRYNFWEKSLYFYVIINIMLQSLWIHNKVKIQNKYVFCKDLYEKGFHIAHVYLLLKVNSLVMR